MKRQLDIIIIPDTTNGIPNAFIVIALAHTATAAIFPPIPLSPPQAERKKASVTALNRIVIFGEKEFIAESF
ncbi:MAG: hypothetical protein LBR60_05525 [Fibrobacter sp.]|jgi:hypothetical protein|nr:hypothetical protein [Fibrobacter sp.]